MRGVRLDLLPFYKRYSSYIKTVREEDRQKFSVSLYIIFTLLTVSLFGLFAIKPTLVTVSNLKKQYEDNKLIYNALRTKLEALQNLDGEYLELTPNLSLMYLAIPVSSKIPYLTRQIEKLSEANGLYIVRLDVGTVEVYPAKKTNPPVFAFSFNLTLQGKQADINNFLAEFINFDRLLSVERLTTSKAEDTSGTYQASIIGKAYFYEK